MRTVPTQGDAIVGPCRIGFVRPDSMAGEADMLDVQEVDDAGPNHGLWWVYDVTLLSRTAAGRNPQQPRILGPAEPRELPLHELLVVQPGGHRLLERDPHRRLKMRTMLIAATALITWTPGLRAQLLSTMDTISVPHLVDRWTETQGWDHPVYGMVEYILHEPDDPRTDDLFEELAPLLRVEHGMLPITTAGVLGRADAERPGKWTDELIAMARDVVDERNDVVSKGLISNGSLALKNQGRPLLIRRLMDVSEENPPGASYIASILVNGLWDLPGAREELRGLYERGEIQGAARFAVWGKLQGGG